MGKKAGARLFSPEEENEIGGNAQRGREGKNSFERKEIKIGPHAIVVPSPSPFLPNCRAAAAASRLSKPRGVGFDKVTNKAQSHPYVFLAEWAKFVPLAT